MQATKVLEMINSGKLEDLKLALQDEIFTESLKGKADVKKRYAAMKKYINNTDSAREILRYPCPVEFEGTEYNAFCNAYSLALTKEPIGEIVPCPDPDRYPNVTQLIKYDGDEYKIDLNEVLALAKSKGYKYKKSENHSNEFLLHYDGAYFRIGLIDITYGIINNGEEVTAYHSKGAARRPLVIQNDIGICVIMPVHLDADDEETRNIIEVR